MTTVILAGGLGTRLSEETITRPKPLVEVGGKPLLWHIMSIYSHFGFQKFIVALGYKGHMIKEYFLNYKAATSDLTVRLGDGHVEVTSSSRPDWEIQLIDTGQDTLTGGRLARLEPTLRKENNFMLTYGDGVCTVDIRKLVAFHQKHGKKATVTAVRPPARFGALTISGSKVVSFKEKTQSREGWINGGYFVFSKGIFDYLTEGDSTVLELSPLERLAREGELMAYRHPDFWQCVDTIRDRQYLEEIWASSKAPWKSWT